MWTGEFLGSVVVLLVCVGFGGFYLAKQLGWFGGLAIERLGGGTSRWSRFRRRLTAVLCMALGVLFFLGMNWVDPRADPVFFAGYWLALVVLCLAAFFLGLQDFRQVRDIGRQLRASSFRLSSEQRRRIHNQLRRPGGGDGDSAEDER